METIFEEEEGNKSLSNVQKTGSSTSSSKNVVSSFDKTALIQDGHPEVICWIPQQKKPCGASTRYP